MAKDTEACGRCSMTVVVDAVDDENATREDPFGDDRIEVEERQLERASPEAWFGRVSARVNRIVSRFAWGR
ncbi:hypothetical protein [Halobellus ruber]|uniref:Uncharacterized protein n=1 Tax=Halobellus ruber TaxID=2761102 RepID=A0A7J9SFJ0_9EURY|nr:hypothetical protein [Halobellus ruber]MBB6644766.1 hypothetical protein [Halobellus ruber]